MAHSVLSGLTRDTIIRLAKERGIEVRECAIPRELLYLADEAFFTGTAAEIAPIRSVDRLTVRAGKRGPITARVQGAFFGVRNAEQHTPDAIARDPCALHVALAGSDFLARTAFIEGQAIALDVPDAFGLRPSMRDMGRRLSADGYAVLVPNPFYRVGKGPFYETAAQVDFSSRT